jgi:hypothetical protein
MEVNLIELWHRSVTALEKLLDRIVRQLPVSERQLKRALKSASLDLHH